MTVQSGIKNQINRKRLDFALSIGIILILFIPVYSWFLVSLYQTQILIPQEWQQFKQQEQQILQSLQEYKNQNHIYPDSLSILVQETPRIAEMHPSKWSFHYGVNKNSEFLLSATLPKSWFGWATERICESQQNTPPTCNFKYICNYKHGIQRSMEMDPMIQEPPSQPIFGNASNPCT